MNRTVMILEKLVLFICLFKRYLLRAYQMPDPLLDAGHLPGAHSS